MSGSSGSLASVAVVSALVSDLARARTSGPFVWTHLGSKHDGEVEVVHSLVHLGRTRLRMVANEHRPAEPKLQYLTPEGWARRLCVNTAHRPLPGTHKHYVGGAGISVYSPDDIPVPPLAPCVGPGVLHAILVAFAAECRVELADDFVWTPPWMGA